MDDEFLSQVESAMSLIQSYRLRELGGHPLLELVPRSLERRLAADGEEAQSLAPAYRGDVAREYVGEIVERMKPPGDEDLNEPAWREYIILQDYVMSRQPWRRVAGRLALRRATFFEWRKRAVEDLAIELWSREQNAVRGRVPVMDNLPYAPYASYVPRHDNWNNDYVEWIIVELTAGRAWFVEITGPPGVGKTTVAYETARRCRQRELFDFIVWTSAAQQVLRPPTLIRVAEYVTSLATILDLIGTTMGNREVLAASGISGKRAVVDQLLRSHQVLVIMDNMESMGEEGQADVYGYLEELPRPSKAVITGRERRYVGRRAITLEGMSLETALQFMREEAAGRNLAPLSREEVEQIHDGTDGNPLAMQQVMGLMQTLGCPLHDALPSGERPPHDQMLDFMYAEAYERLKDSEKRILHVMPLFSEPAAADAIQAASGVSGPQLSVGLGRLYMSFLVQKAGEGRYELLPFTREYLRSMLRRDGVPVGGLMLKDFLTQAHKSLAEHYLEYLAAMGLDDQLRFLKWEKRNILSLMRWCFANMDWESVIAFANQMGRPLATLQRLQELLECGNMAIKACEILGKTQEAEWLKLYIVAWTYLHSPESEQRQEGRRLYEAGLQLSRDKGDKRLEALALRHLGGLAKEDGKLDRALELSKRSLALWQELEDGDERSGWVARTVHLIGEVQLELGSMDDARRNLREAWTMGRDIGDGNRAVKAQSDLALLLVLTGEEEEALSISDDAVRLSGRIAKPARTYAYAQFRRAEIEKHRGNAEEAIRRADEARRTYEALGMHHRSARVDKLLAALRDCAEGSG